MPRRNFDRKTVLPVHVSARANNGDWFALPLDTMWEIFCDELLRISWIYGANIHAFVMMVNHYHLILSVTTHDFGVVMREFNRRVAQRANLLSGREDHLFGGPYYPSVVTSTAHFADVLKYVYRNPVKAGVTELVEDYKYSTLHGLLGCDRLRVPLRMPYGGIFVLNGSEETCDSLEWLNNPFANEQDEAIRKGLRRKEFAYPIRFQEKLRQSLVTKVPSTF